MMPQRMERALGWGTLACGCGAIVFLVGAIFLRVNSFDTVRGWLDRAASGGVDEPYTREVHDRLAVAGLAMASGMGLATALLAMFRKKVAAAIAHDVAAELADLSALWRGASFDWRAAAIVAALTATGFALRWHYLFRPLHYDECVGYVEAASRPLWVAVSSYYAPNNHIFHTLWVGLSTRLLGDDPWAIRLPAFLAGTLMVPATYLTASLFHGRATGILAAALVAVSSTLVEYSTNGRGYTLLCLLFIGSLVAARHVLRTNGWLGWGALALLWTLGLWTIPTMLFGVATVALWLAVVELVSARERGLNRAFFARGGLALVVTVIATVVLYSPVLIRMGPAALTRNEWVSPKTLAYVAANLPDSLATTWREWNRDIPWPLSLVLLAGFVAGLAPRHRREVPLAPVAVLACLGLTFVERVDPFPRVWLFLLPVYFMTAAWGIVRTIEWVAPRGWGHAVVGMTTAILAATIGWHVYADQSIRRTVVEPHADEVAGLVAERLRPDDLVICVLPTAPPLEYYFRKLGVPLSHIAYRDDSVTNPRRLFVVETVFGQTFDRLLDGSPWAERADQRTKRLIEQFDGTALYQIELSEPRE